MSVKVKIKYKGWYAQKTNDEIEELFVSKKVSEANVFLVKYFHEKYCFDPPYILMINSIHIIGAVKKNILLKDGDMFELLPFISGG